MEGLEYSITFNGEEVTANSAPMKLKRSNLNTIVVDLYTEDFNYIGLNDLIVTASL